MLPQPVRLRLLIIRTAMLMGVLALGGYAAAELVALLGGAIWFTGGDRTWYILGLVLMTVSFQILPIRRN